MLPNNFIDIDSYIAVFPPDTREKLRQVRETIRECAPEAVETISYQMPTFKLKGNLVHFAAFKNHIGFYPAPRGIEEFKKELSRWNGGKGSVQFPINEPLPLDLISRMVRFRVQQNMQRPSLKAK